MQVGGLGKMTIYEKLTVANFAISCTMLVLLVVAMVPHVKQGLTVVRDAVLWAAMVLVVFLVLSAAWVRFRGSATEGLPAMEPLGTGVSGDSAQGLATEVLN